MTNLNKKLSKAIFCEHLLTMQNGSAEIKKNQVILIEKEKIHSILPASQTLPPVEHTIHLDNHLVCPGLINTHTHLPMVLFRGLGDHLSLKKWLEEIIFPLEKKMITPDFIRQGTELACLELIKSGTTTVCDMYFHTPVMAKVIEQYGLRAILGVDMLSSFSDWKKDLDILQIQYGTNNKSNKRIYPALACHAPYTCKPDLLKLSALEAKKRGLTLLIHVAETKWEVSEIKKLYGKTPVAHLKDCGVIGPHCVFAHSIHLSEQDLNIMAETKTAISYNPESNMKLGSGIAPILKALEKGIPVGLGTDGCASNNNLNMFQEMDTGAKLQKLGNPDQTLAPKSIFSLATNKGALALGLQEQIGQIRPGFFADIIALDLNYPHFYPLHDLLSHLVYSANGGEVSFTMCHGKVLMQNYKFQGIDSFKIYAQAEMIKEKIQKTLSRG